MKRGPLVIAGMVLLVIVLIIGLYFLLRPTAKLTVSGGNAFGDTGSGTVTPQSTTEAGTGANEAGTVVAPNLIQITSSPVSAGEVAIDIPSQLISPTSTVISTAVSTTTSSTSSTTSKSSPAISATQTQPATYSQPDVAVRYIDRESGNVYSYLALSRKLTRVSNKTLPGIQEASWLPDGSTAFVRFLADSDGTQHIDTYALPFDGNGGYFLQQDLSQATVLGQNAIFELVTGTDNSIGSISSADGSTVSTVFTSPMTSIVARAAGAGSGKNPAVIAVTRASASLDGYAFAVSNGSFTPILGPLKGLTILPSPSGNELLYSYTTNGSSLHMATLDLTTGTVTNLPLATLAEKCVWTSDSTALYCAIPSSFSGTIPDDWYQGAVSFTDKIWRLDLTTRLATLVVDPTAANAKVTIDAVNLTIDPNSQVLIFRNKKDSSLWAYSL